MARPKYKIGSFIKYTVTGGTASGEVTGVISRKDGYSYEVEENQTIVTESDVLAAYRPVVARKAAKKPAKAAAPKTRKPVSVQEEKQAAA